MTQIDLFLSNNVVTIKACKHFIDLVSFNHLLHALKLAVGHAKITYIQRKKWYGIKETHFRRDIIGLICEQIFGHL